MRIPKIAALVLALALSVAGPGAILAQEGTFADPEPLTVGTPVTATLTGDPDGVFSYYALDYPGGNALMALVFVLDEAGAALPEGTAGVNIRGARTFIAGDATPDDETDVTLLHILAGDADPAVWPIQVYSFAEEEIEYTLAAYTLTVDALLELLVEGAPLPIGTPTTPAAPGTPTTPAPGAPTTAEPGTPEATGTPTAAATPTGAASPTTPATLPTAAPTPTTAASPTVAASPTTPAPSPTVAASPTAPTTA